MNIMKAFLFYNVKALMKDKLSFIWSILFPLITFGLQRNNIIVISDLICWWVYMIICAYTYGVGLYASELRDEGSLKTIFSINDSSVCFFLANLCTQILYVSVSLLAFNSVVFLLKKFSMWEMVKYSLFAIVACIPLAFLSYIFTMLKHIHIESMKTIFSIIIFGLFVGLSFDTELNLYNPLYFVSLILCEYSWKNLIIYLAGTIVSVTIGIIAICRFDPCSYERR